MEIPGPRMKLKYSLNPLYLYSFFSRAPHSFLFPSFSSPPHKTLVLLNLPHSFNRFHSKAASNSVFSSISPTVSFSTCAYIYPDSQSSESYASKRRSHAHLLYDPGLLGRHRYRSFGSFLASSFDGPSHSNRLRMMTSTENSQIGTKNSDGFKSDATPKQVSDIIDLIRSDAEDSESKLDSMNVSLSDASISQIFRVLNSQRVSALRFFNWIKSSLYDSRCGSDIYSLTVDNCGRLDDYKTMLLVLNDLRMKNISLNPKAFGFLPALLSDETLTKSSVKKVVEILNKVGGSCRTSGIYSLIEMFCLLGSFKMSKFIMEITERKTTFYNIIVREMCRRCDFEGARGTLEEMMQVGCDPNVSIYNYFLSSLCNSDRFTEASETLKEMQERDCPPDALSYEIFIYYFCKGGNFDLAYTFLDKMVSRGLEPRLTTHAAFVKGYFNSQRYEMAYNYVLASGDRHKLSRNANYSLLASLHEKKGNVVVARNIIFEMIEVGLRPNFSVYNKVLKHLRLLGREDLANDLKCKFSSFNMSSTKESR